MFELQRLYRHPLELLAELEAPGGLEDAPTLAARIRQCLYAAIAGGMEGVAAARLISHFNVRLTERIVVATAQRHRLPPVAWCWLALGSEGRHEQTFVTDQDNGLIFQASSAQEADALRALFLPFAQDANLRLAEAGFELCPGKIMAGNPAWCLSLDEWREQFIAWVRRPEPEALLNASIFFDLRQLYGTPELGEQLRTLLLSMTVATPSFQHLMAANALQAEAPLGFRGELALDGRHEIDLKKYGSRIFVDAARILALGTGTRAVDTVGRLQQAGSEIGLPAQEVAGLISAFGHILRLRLQQQVAVDETNDKVGSGLKPAGLHELDRAILREALKQAKRLQQRLKLNYAL